jgi:hypothetical protein
MFIHSVPMRLLGEFVGLLAVFKSLPGELLPGLVILLVMSHRRAPMSVRRKVVQLSGALMILVMRSVVIALGHL